MTRRPAPRPKLRSACLTLETLEERNLPSAVIGVEPPPDSSQSTAVISSSSIGPLTPDQAYVQSLYVNLLGRQGSISELNSWVKVMNSPYNGVGISGQAAVADDILESQESSQRIINNLYQQLLGRPADAQGLTNWTNVLNLQEIEYTIYYPSTGAIPLENGYGTEETVIAGIMSSSEYLAKTGGNVVSNYYQVLLGRAPTTDELNHYNLILRTQGANTVASDLVQSVEYRTDYTEALYHSLLGRAPTSQEASFYATLNPNTIDPLLMIEYDILKSPEYFAHAPYVPGVS